MRKIKFRAWANGRMWTDEAIVRRNGEFIVGVWNNEETDIVEPYHDVIIQQFTGLHDKNGKEIYEGDIIKNDYHPHRYVVEWLGKNSKGYGVHAWVLRDAYNSDDAISIGNHTDEIIGNIYENPEYKNPELLAPKETKEESH